MNETLARTLYFLLIKLLELINEHLKAKILDDAPDDLKPLWTNSNGALLPINQECFAQFRDAGYIHPAQLYGRDLANYALCLVNKDQTLYQCRNKELAGEAFPADGSCDEYIQQGWQSRNWDPNLALYFPDLSPLPAWEGLDPFDPRDFTQEYQGGIWLPIWNKDSLPYLTESEISTPNPSRLALAQATIKMWQTLGLTEFDNPAYLAAWINRYEHGGAIDAADGAPEYMSKVIYTTYIQAGGDVPLFMSGWSVTLFTQRTQDNVSVEGRTFKFLERVLTPLSDKDLALWGNPELWENMPSIDTLGIDPSATKTFGSTELNPLLRKAFHADTSRYTAVFPEGAYDEEQLYVYVMTPCQWNNAHATKGKDQLLTINC